MVRDMTQGKPRNLILSFALPLLLGNLFQQMYNLADTMIVGKFLGINELAAVGATGSISFLIIGFCRGICTGFGIPIAQKFGAGDESGLRRYVANSVWLAAGLAVIVTAATLLLGRYILGWMKTPEDIIDGSLSYISVIFAGIPFTILYNLTATIIRSMGDSKTPVYFLTLSSILNVVLDLFCILVLKLGVAGAAAATVVSQGVSGICCLIFMIKKYEILRMTKQEWAPDMRRMKQLMIMGLPMGLQTSVTAIGSVILQSAVNSLGTIVVASNTAAGKVACFFCIPIDALGSTMATFAGQNMGAKKPERIRQGFKEAVVIGCIYGVVTFAVASTVGKYGALLFMDGSETAILDNVQLMLTCHSAFYIPLILLSVVRYVVQGVGYPGIAMFSGVFELAARALVSFLFVPVFGFLAVCLAEPFAWVLADLFLFPVYFHIMKKMRKEE